MNERQCLYLKKKSGISKSGILNGNYDEKYLIGEYEYLYLGHSNDHMEREKGSSGGIGTALLKYLLEKNIVDGVIGVGFSSDDPLKCIYKLVNVVNDVLELAGSKYVYMGIGELGELIEKNHQLSLAVIAQPCHVQVLRVWQKKRFSNIKYIFSFFCGYNISPKATKYMTQKANIPHNDILSIEYRGGKYPGGFRVAGKSGSVVQFGKENYELIDLMFLLPHCHRCHFYMGEFADIVLGDAWVKEHENLTTIITRTQIGNKLLRNMYTERWLCLYELSKSELIKMHKHNLKYKKFGHGIFMKFLVWLFRDFCPSTLIPFHFLGKLSKYRRKFKIGISIPILKKIDFNSYR